MNGIVYAIKFPESDDRSVYVGVTREDRFQTRQREHKYEARRQPLKRIVYKWMSRRISDGFEPVFEILCVVPVEQLSDQEVKWQKFFKALGWNCKHQHGGDHQVGYEFTESHKKALSDAAKKRPRRRHTESTRKKISESWDESRMEKHLEQVSSEGHRKAVSEGLKRAYAEGRRKPVRNMNVSDWTCNCGRTMRATSKGMHRKACNG